MADTSPRIFSAQLHVKEDGFADGKTLSEVLAKAGGNLRIDRIQRSDSLFLAKLPSVKIQPGDRLFVKDSPDNLKHYEQLLGATLYNLSDNEHPVDDDTPLKAEGQQLAEVVTQNRGDILLQHPGPTVELGKGIPVALLPGRDLGALEAVRNRDWADAQLGLGEEVHDGFGHDVGGRVAHGVELVVRVGVEQLGRRPLAELPQGPGEHGDGQRGGDGDPGRCVEQAPRPRVGCGRPRGCGFTPEGAEPDLGHRQQGEQAADERDHDDGDRGRLDHGHLRNA